MHLQRSFRRPFSSSCVGKICDLICFLICRFFLHLFLKSLDSVHCLELEMAFLVEEGSRFRRLGSGSMERVVGRVD
jgi:hypothetical protein